MHMFFRESNVLIGFNIFFLGFSFVFVLSSHPWSTNSVTKNLSQGIIKENNKNV